MNRRSAASDGFALIELLVVTAVVLVLIGMVLPAVQMVREAARRTTCRNNLRQLGIASQHYECTHLIIPGSWFNAPPDSASYTSDRGLFVQLLPFLELTTVDEQLRTGGSTFDVSSSIVLRNPIPTLECPSSSGEPALLVDMASKFSGPGMVGLEALTCDYIGNSGFIPTTAMDASRTDGPIGVQIPRSGFPKETSARVSDGLSNTLLFWESIGNTIITADGLEFDVNSGAGAAFNLNVYGPPNATYQSDGVASTKSYIHAWAGLRLGNMKARNGRVINVGNGTGGPCSRHPGGVCAVLMDGSVQFLSHLLTPVIGFALASARGGERVDF